MVGGQEKRALSGLLMAFGWEFPDLLAIKCLSCCIMQQALLVPKLQAETLKHLKLS